MISTLALSQLDTFDLKPDAPRDSRPVQTDRTRARHSRSPRCSSARQVADKFSLVEAVITAAVHDSGHQLLQTGHLFAGGSTRRTPAVR